MFRYVTRKRILFWKEELYMPYAILRFEKRKGGPASALEKHHERKKETYASNRDIDPSRTHLNFHLIEPQRKYYAEIQSRIERAQQENPNLKVRKDSVRFIDTIVTASPEFLSGLSQKEAHEYFTRALDFIKQEVGEQNIFSAVVHMDERNPHMHLCFVPLTKDNRLSAKDIIGNRQKLVEWQDKFHDHMSRFYPQLERGESASQTRRKHVPTWLYKQAHRLTQEMTAIRAEVEKIGLTNAGRQREKVLLLLENWYPKVNAFEEKLKPYAQTLDILRENQRTLQSKYDSASIRAQESESELTDLRRELWTYQDFIDTIPTELFEELRQRYEDQLEEQRLE